MSYLAEALLKLRPGAAWTITATGLEWHDTEQVQPSEDEISLAIAQVMDEEQRNLYKRQRLFAYPPITDYIDGVVKGDQSQIDAYIAACQAIKDKYPKP